MASNSGGPSPLSRKLVERPWGGEIWFTAEPELPLLVKFIYTRKALSFQVHPADDYAARHHGKRGKTEMWYIVSAAPDARIALGLRDAIAPGRLLKAAQSEEIQELVNWVTPRPGDAFFTPAGTVHAIGGGIELWEVQENSDVTYRLYDYGSARELHLDHAMNVTNLNRSDARPATLPLRCEWFCVERLKLEKAVQLDGHPRRFQLLIFVTGSGELAGRPFEAGQVWMIPPGAAQYELRCDTTAEALRCREP